ncbi:MAG TPA: SdiA-regulated domain-containing protein [Pyrinomonadaceae bacterium]|nr:SdiA-regulated domain-containing protein [Pyrinomonadaceae bacterium]
MSKVPRKLFACLLVLAIILGALLGRSLPLVRADSSNGATKPAPLPAPPPVTSVDLSTYLRVGRFDLPEPTRTAHPPNSLLAQEASGVTYDWDTDTLFVVGDGGTSVVQVTKTGQLIDSMTLAPGPSPQGTDFFDTEGISYVGSGKFVLLEERDRQVNLFTYVAGGILHKTDVQTVKLGTTIGNIGLEGISFDPLTSGFICVKEKDPQSIFQTGIDFVAGTATNGSATATSSTDLFNPALANLADFSDVFALSNLPSLSGQTDFNHLLVISQESGQIINIDRSGNVSSSLTIVSDPGNPLSVADQTDEGLTMDRDGNLYIVNENGGGDSNHPQLWVYSPSNAPNQAPTAVTLANAVTSIPENASTAAPIRVADIIVNDDGLGPNHLAVTGADAGFFQIIGTQLFLRAGTALNATTKPSYSVVVSVDDPTVGSTPDASANFTLTITPFTGGNASIIISEVAPWSSGNSDPSLRVDWFEVTNIGNATANITGWKMDDDSHTFNNAVALNGITNIAPGESVIFLETADLAGKSAAFKALWFGTNPPPNLQIGSYNGSGVGLSTGGDQVNLFDSGGTLQAGVAFSTSPSGPFPSFDNAAGLNNTTISALSAVGVNGAFAAAHDANEIGSPGTIGAAAAPVVNITATDANATETGNDTGTFHITRSGGTLGPLTVSYTIATGPGRASAADYTPTLTGAATIPAGQSFVDITITPVNDNLVEGNETLTLTLGDSGSYDVGANKTATVTIADNPFLGVAAGDADVNGAILWTRFNRAASVSITAQVSTDPGFSGTPLTFNGMSDTSKDFTLKLMANGLQANTRYFYRFVVDGTGETSGTGTFKTVPLANSDAPLHFAFSGDNDGLMRPYALANVIPAQQLDFYLNLGDVIYETASNLTASGPHNGQPWLNSPSVTLSNDSLTFNGIPRAFIPGSAPFATQAQLKADYEKKYRENFLPVNVDGQNSLQILHAAQGNYTTWDNHELGNRKYIDGGAPAGGSVGGPAGTDMPSGRGVDARNFTGANTGGSGNVNNVNDAADLLSPGDLANLGGFMNKALGFQALQNVFLEYEPIADRGLVNAPNDPRTNGTRQLYSAVHWGRNSLFVNTDSRSYRDIRLKTDNAAADDTGPRADNSNRTYLGVTQLAWLKQTLLNAQNDGTTWKFVSVSDPIDQLGPIGGALSGTLTSVNADGGKSFIGGYRAERNDLLKFIADNHITNVVFLSTDDHQNRINELYYSPSGQTNLQSSYVKVPFTFAIVCGPLGATGPDAITDHSFTNVKAIADSLANAQVAAGIDPIGLQNYPGLHNLTRDGDPTAGTNPQPVDFYSPDTFNFTVLDVSPNGKTLTVKSIGMNSTAQNAGIEYPNGPQARTLFQFQIDGLNQAITFPQPPDKTYGDAPFALNATASSGLPVSYAANGNCTVSGNIVTLTAAGSCTITASQAGDANFSPALDVTRTFSIARAPVTATAGSGVAIYDGLPKSPSSCVLSGPFVGTLVCVNNPASVGPDPGTTVIVPVVSGDTLSNFDITLVNGAFTIGSLKVSTQAIRAELSDALATATNRKDKEELKDAIQALDTTLNPSLWTIDGNHLTCPHGKKVFKGHEEAVEELMEMIRDRSSSNISDATIQRWVNILVAIDRKLATTAIAEATGVNPKKIAAALVELAKGDLEGARGHFDEAIKHYQKAWKRVSDCDDDDDDE